MRAPQLLLQHDAKACKPVELVAAAGDRPCRAGRPPCGRGGRTRGSSPSRARSLRARSASALARVEHVRAHDAHDSLAQLGRVAQPAERRAGELGAHLLVALRRVARASRSSAAARRSRARRRAACRGRGRARRAARAAACPRRRPPGRPRTCARRRSGRGSGSPARSRSRGSNSGSSCTSTPVSRAIRSAFAGLRAEQELRELAEPVRREPAADPLARDEAHAAASSRICAQRLLVGVEVELRDEAQPAHDAQRILREAVRRDGRRTRALEVVAGRRTGRRARRRRGGGPSR